MAKDIPVENYNSVGKVDSSKFDWNWWRSSKESAHLNVMGTFRALEVEQNYRSLMNLRNARLYGNMQVQGLSAYDYSKISNLPAARATMNVVRACVDTAAARIAKNKPRTLFLTERGKHSEQRRARLLTDYIAGSFEDGGVYQEGQLQFLEGSVFGTGALKVFPEDGKIRAERAMIDEIYVDDVEGLYGKPRNLYHRKLVPKDSLLELYKKDPVKLEWIKAASESEISQRYTRIRGVEMVAVVEAWHLRTSKQAKDGRRALCVENGCLEFEQWDRDYFPFVFFKWAPRLLGFYGSGMPEDIIGIQIEINRILRNITESSELFAVPRIFTQKGSSLSKPLNNKIAGMYEYAGANPPVFLTPAAMSPDIYAHLERLYNRAFEIVGISQLSATGKKPSGLDSGAALREYNDIEDERFSLVSQRYESSFIDLSYMFVNETRELVKQASGKHKAAIKTKSGKFMRSIEWEDVNLEDDRFIMRAYPTNLLPSSPAGRMQKATELTEKGWVPKEHAMALLDFPDVEQFTSLETAAVEDIQFLIEEMVDHGRYESPDPLMNLPLALRMVQSAYLRAKRDKVPAANLEKMRLFLSESAKIINQSLTPQTTAAASGAVPDQPQALAPDPSQQAGAELPLGEAPIA